MCISCYVLLLSIPCHASYTFIDTSRSCTYYMDPPILNQFFKKKKGRKLCPKSNHFQFKPSFRIFLNYLLTNLFLKNPLPSWGYLLNPKPCLKLSKPLLPNTSPLFQVSFLNYLPHPKSSKIPSKGVSLVSRVTVWTLALLLHHHQVYHKSLLS